jgi:hypothetical protein
MVAALVLAACETPNARLIYEVANGPAQSCGSANCADVKIPCEAVISIRVLRPDDPTAPLLTICEPLPQNRNKDLCSIAAVDLGDMPIELPKETLEVQVLIWNRVDATNPDTSELDCGRHDIEFDAVDGFPIAHKPTPAIGGHTFYHPGDQEIRVTLGCTDLQALNQCSAENQLSVTSTVERFENIGVAVDPNAGSRLSVAIGEPTLKGAAAVHSLEPADTRPLDMEPIGQAAIWEQGSIDLDFVDVGCVQVLEDGAQNTATLTCDDNRFPPIMPMLDMRAFWLSKPSLDQVLAALGLAQFPPSGLTIGIVVDDLGVPIAGETVTASPSGTIRYLSADRTSVGGSQTTASGMFVSLDAGLPTAFSVAGGIGERTGGRVQGKVTLVVLEK